MTALYVSKYIPEAGNSYSSTVYTIHTTKNKTLILTRYGEHYDVTDNPENFPRQIEIFPGFLTKDKGNIF